MIEENLKLSDKRVITADSPDVNHYSFKEWTGDTDAITVGTIEENHVTITMPSRNITLNATYNPYRILTVDNGIILSDIRFGLLYNWFAANDIRNIANTNAHVPSEEEWDSLADFLGGYEIAGNKLREEGNYHWSISEYSGTNDVGFSAVGSGRRADPAQMSGLFTESTFWTCNELADIYGRHRLIASNSLMLWGMGSGSIKTNGYSLRLVVTEPINIVNNFGIYIGNDQKRYRCVLINGTWWMANNLAETKYRDGSLIPEVINDTVWENLTTGAMCAYNNDSIYI